MCIPTYTGAVGVSAPDYFSDGLSQGSITNVNCTGTETNILDCGHQNDSPDTCNSAGVVCQGVFKLDALLGFVI